MTILVGGPRHGERTRIAAWPFRVQGKVLDIGDGQKVTWPSGCYRLDGEDDRFAEWHTDDPTSLLGQQARQAA
jgi:hypothetical protein